MSSLAELYTTARGHLRATNGQIAPQRIAPRAAEISENVRRLGIANALR